MSLAWSARSAIFAFAVSHLAGCSSRSDEQSIRELASGCGMPDLKVERRGELIVIDEPRVSGEVGVTPASDRQRQVHQVVFDCIMPKAKQAEIRVDWPFTVIID